MEGHICLLPRAGGVENTSLQFDYEPNWVSVNLQPVATWIDGVYGSAAALGCKPQWSSW